MKFSEFRTEILKRYAEKMPGFKCAVNIYRCLGKSITIDCAVEGGINDMFHISFIIHDMPGDLEVDSELPENMVLTSINRNYMIKPEHEYLYCSSRKIPFRKTEGNPEKIINTLDKFFGKLHESLEADMAAGNIHKDWIDRITELMIAENLNTFKFEYQLLDRCRCDCNYYLGAGGRNEKHLWAGNVKAHIAKMKELWNLLPEKPEWLSMEQILEYEKLMEN